MLTGWQRWGFPSKQNPAHKNPAIVARLRELWEQNYTQKDIVETLVSEGYPINDREVIRLRLRLKLLLRESATKPKRKHTTPQDAETDHRLEQVDPEESSGFDQLRDALQAEQALRETGDNIALPVAAHVEVDGGHISQPANEDVSLPHLTAEQILQKQLRQAELQQESDEKFRAKKRRRRTRGWAGLPADTPGEPPRFPSETTIDEAKAYLALDNIMYRQLRERFAEICKEDEIFKKTNVGPERWAKAVRKLINESTHLYDIFSQEEPGVLQGHHEALFRPKKQKALSIDVICMDVTKRLRTLDSRMTLADAKNILVLNPEHTRNARTVFAAILRADHFTNKHEAGEQHWADLKTAWVNECPLLATTLARGSEDSEYDRKLKAIEIIARDVMKRQRQETTSKDPSQKKQVHQGPGPGPAPPVIVQQPGPRRTIGGLDPNDSPGIDPTEARHNNLIALAESADLQIDPSLLLAASDAAELPMTEYLPTQQFHPEGQQQQQPDAQDYHQAYPQQNQTYYHPEPVPPQTTSAPQHPMPHPIYFRLHPHSDTPFQMKTMWLSVLQQPLVSEIQNLATREHPSTQVLKLEGMIMYRGEHGEREMLVEISTDDELSAYLDHVKSMASTGPAQGQGKATFVVLLDVASSGGYV